MGNISGRYPPIGASLVDSGSVGAGQFETPLHPESPLTPGIAIPPMRRRWEGSVVPDARWQSSGAPPSGISPIQGAGSPIAPFSAAPGRYGGFDEAPESEGFDMAAVTSAVLAGGSLLVGAISNERANRTQQAYNDRAFGIDRAGADYTLAQNLGAWNRAEDFLRARDETRANTLNNLGIPGVTNRRRVEAPGDEAYRPPPGSMDELMNPRVDGPIPQDSGMPRYASNYINSQFPGPYGAVDDVSVTETQYLPPPPNGRMGDLRRT